MAKLNINVENQQEALESKISALRLGGVEAETEAKARVMGLPYVKLVGVPIPPETLALVDIEDAKKAQALTFFYNGKEFALGVVEKNDVATRLLDSLVKELHVSGQMFLISPQSFETAMKIYESLPRILPPRRGIEITAEDLVEYRATIGDFGALQKAITDATISDVVTVIFAGAINSRASDVHIEAEEKSIKVRYRIDGVLQDVAEIDKSRWTKIVARIKLLANLKINVSDKPQDGHFTIYMTNDRIDLRISCLPTSYGESVVVRLLLSSSTRIQIAELGLRPRLLAILQTEMKRPNGMIISTGPTGSGKTTTQYAILTQLNKPDIKIITIEDPVEYELEGINQSQVNEEYTFAKGLRSIVRQDPDIIMVGEIRDQETAEISIQAALTGHLVLSTVHTNSAAAAVPRFMSLGAKPFLLAPALNLIIGQRLVRRLCPDCKKVEAQTPEMMARIVKVLEGLPAEDKTELDLTKMVFYKGQGCAACNNLGYKGRIGIYEFIQNDKDIQAAIIGEQVAEYEIVALAQKKGMATMAQDGLLKALQGITTPEEVFRVAE